MRRKERRACKHCKVPCHPVEKGEELARRSGWIRHPSMVGELKPEDAWLLRYKG